MSKNELRRILTLLAVLALAFAVGCSDDDDPTGPGGGGDDSPTFAGPETYNVPNSMTTSANPNAQLAVGYTTQINLASTYAAFLSSPVKAANDGPPWVDTFTYGGFTVELTVDEDGDDWTYEARLSGTVGEESYDNDLIYRARQSKTGGNGYLDFMDPTTGYILSRWDWNTTSTSLIAYDGMSPAGAYILTPDGSGGADLEVWNDGLPSGDGWLGLAMSWDAAGNGSWISYDDQGGETDSGVWP